MHDTYVENGSIMTLEETSRSLCDILTRSGFNKEAREISAMIFMISTLDNNDKNRLTYINDLISRCHVKWLGDYYISDLSYKEWTGLIHDFKVKLSRER